MEGTREHPLRAPNPLAASEGAKNSQAGTKRLFSDRVSRLIDSDTYDENDPPEIDAENRDEKRSRASDWPLRKASPLTTQVQHDQRDPTSTHRSQSPVRGSRFVEGSMNDRASKVPPVEFIEDERLREEYSRPTPRGRSRATAQRSSTTLPAPEKVETRHSGIFRFGKSVAATFNPVNWKIWKQQPLQDENAQQRALRERQERAERIYKELKEAGRFRDSAHPPTFRVAEDGGDVRDGKRGKHDSIASQQDGTAMEHDNTTTKHDNTTTKHDNTLYIKLGSSAKHDELTFVKHDSGIDFGNSTKSELTSKGEKRRGRVFIEPPTFSDDESPYSDPTTAAPPRTLTQAIVQTDLVGSKNPDPSPRKPQPPSGSRRRSLSIPRLRKQTTTAPSPQASESENPSRNNALGSRGLRRVSSRSDLKRQKRTQRKLVKRVSDLEVKLAAARKELLVVKGDVPASETGPASALTKAEIPQSESLSSKIHIKAREQDEKEEEREEEDDEVEEEIRVTRPRFVPGALATLPSERLLSGYIPPDLEEDEDEADDDKDADEKIGRAVSTDNGGRKEGFEWPDYVF